MSHPVMYFEVSGKDAAKLTDFYAGLFEWNVNTDPSTGYGCVDPVERGMGGGIAPTSDGSPGTVALLDQLEPELEQDHRWHAARADLLMRAGRSTRSSHPQSTPFGCAATRRNEPAWRDGSAR